MEPPTWQDVVDLLDWQAVWHDVPADECEVMEVVPIYGGVLHGESIVVPMIGIADEFHWFYVDAPSHLAWSVDYHLTDGYEDLWEATIGSDPMAELFGISRIPVIRHLYVLYDARDERMAGESDYDYPLAGSVVDNGRPDVCSAWYRFMGWF